ncbi:MAG: hypothetical protein KVP17_000306 [Porospora cf. gigantea B]|uniref:uncharacterized protein n=1 Tax=Porospora cf. gigantea B TaxID=2853592 RepID=UPI003571A08B|nr:MAG: hypothetical protein KVP17_000306 [Porospora cf. gigantea B]
MSAPFQFGNAKRTVSARPSQRSWAEVVMEHRPNYKAPTTVADDNVTTGDPKSKRGVPAL